MNAPLAAAHLAVSAVLLVWDIALAARIARDPRAPRAFAAVTALAGLLIAPALIVAATTGSMLLGRSIQTIAWVWPATLVLFAIQASWAALRRFVTPLIAVPIAVYDGLIAAAAVVSFFLARGIALPPGALTLVAAHATAFAVLIGPAALTAPFLPLLPVLAPGFAARHATSALARGVFAVGATLWLLLLVLQVPIAARTLRSYAHYGDDPVQERPSGDFRIGVKILPDLDANPSPLALRRDFEVVDSLDADVLGVVVRPEGATIAMLDSLRRALDERRHAGARLVIALGYPRSPLGVRMRPESLGVARRLHAVDRIARILRPDILLPADAPYGAEAVAAHGELPVATWRDYLTRAAELVHGVNPNIDVGLASAEYGARDSTLYAWAADRASPVDVVGFVLLPGVDGARALDADMRTAQRWIRSSESRKPHWVFATGGFPVAHGDRSQALAIRGALAWATSRPQVRGFVVWQTGDYDRAMGLRAANGRLREATFTLARAAAVLRETKVPEPVGR